MDTITADPVCGMTIPNPSQAVRTTYEARSVAFCSAACRDQFLADPQRYAAATVMDTAR